MGFNKFIGNVGLWTKDHLPEILVGTGIVAGVAATVTACFATPKAIQAKKEMAGDLDVIEITHEDGVVIIDGKEEEYTDEDYKKDLTSEYIRGGAKVVAPFALPLGLTITSIACVLTGFGLMKKRAAAAISLLAVTTAAFDEYRNRVIADQGTDKDREYFTGMKPKEIEVETVNEKGKTVKVKETQWSLDPKLAGNPLLSPYAIKLDSNNSGFRTNRGDPFYMKNWLSIVQSNATTKLHLRGHLFLADVLEMLEVTPESYADLNTDIIHMVGWIDEDPNGDSFVDFGCFNPDNDNLEMVRGIDGECYLSFNCRPILGLTKAKTSEEKMQAWRDYPEIEK